MTMTSEHHPDTDRLPRRLSPSRLNDFVTCPKLFHYKTILGLGTPPTIATAKGNLAHTAFERIFDHPAGARTPDVAVGYLAPAWAAMLAPDLDSIEDPELRRRAADGAAEYAALAPPGSEAERGLLAGAEQVVRSWFSMERVDNFDPTAVELPDGSVVDGRELHLLAEVAGVSMHGFVDRLDRWVAADGTARYAISDYKTGKVPRDRYLDKYWLQLRIYAVLARLMLGVEVNVLRLVFVASGDRDAGVKTLRVDERLLAETAEQVAGLWEDISSSARAGRWQARTGPLCSWCHFKDVCPAWATDRQDGNVPGT